ncbi:hyaluronidase-2-like isoform X2 [Leucoraja erinacea]|uniref:hyaluronidase-2-like isoform X2 n=1 Tax=Leucoraja erinaceus TaxID=7782 RepID=UPI0024574C77|nr:hyaluronidase-2-like isoform X2 [Leucoraja erinacea]
MGQRTARLARTATCVVALWAVAAGSARELRQTTAFAGQPFITVWNAPTHDCDRYSVPLDLSLFDMVASPNEGFYDQQLTIFYKDRLGQYPHYADGGPVHGGVPQNASLHLHLAQLERDVQRYMRSRERAGLAVIDWEEWRPLWIRNWQGKQVYRDRSLALVQEHHSDWDAAQRARQAQFEFEQAARKFMISTLQRARNKRPRSLWGFYLFPDCYNHGYAGGAGNYTGHCPDVEVSRNDLLAWLWAGSTALYPSIYLASSLRARPGHHGGGNGRAGSRRHHLLGRHRLQQQCGALPDDERLPVRGLGPLPAERHLGDPAVQPLPVRGQRALRAEEQRGRHLPTPEPLQLPHRGGAGPGRRAAGDRRPLAERQGRATAGLPVPLFPWLEGPALRRGDERRLSHPALRPSPHHRPPALARNVEARTQALPPLTHPLP